MKKTDALVNMLISDIESKEVLEVCSGARSLANRARSVSNITPA